MDKKLMIRISVLFCIFTIFWGVVYASYWIYAPAQPVSVSNYSLTNFTVTPSSINVGENVTLSVTLDVDNGTVGGPFPVPGALIHFYQGAQGSGNDIGTATTSAQGTAQLEFTVHNYGQIWFYPGYQVP